jgi:hypothetical protein
VKADVHERARILIALSGPEGTSAAESAWLAAHVEVCPACREFAEAMQATVGQLRTIPITADGNLVSATKMRVRQRARELQRRNERFWMICACCAAVTLAGAFTTAILWRGLEWLGQQAQLFPPMWELPFAVFCVMPGIVAGILLLARGTHMADRNGTHRE